MECGNQIRNLPRVFQKHEASLGSNATRLKASSGKGDCKPRLKLANLFLRIFSRELWTTVIKYADHNDIKHNFNKDKQIASKDL